MKPTLTPQDFVAKRRQAAQDHFIDVCRLTGHPTPAEMDPSGQVFTFEAGAGISQGR